MLISVHIPKCAGTSFRFVLRHVYGEKCWENYGRVFSREQARPGIVPLGVRCIHGHFLADAFDGLFPRRQLITWVRHPVERVAATYYHQLRTPDWRDDCCRLLHERKLGLREFAELEWMRNTASRYLAHRPVGAFAFVGVVEEFGASLEIFRRRFAANLLFLEPKTNVNRARTSARYPLTASDFDHILALNEADWLWYEQARLQLGVAARAEGLSIGAGEIDRLAS